MCARVGDEGGMDGNLGTGGGASGAVRSQAEPGNEGEIDVGTLGHAGLYHFRGTVGVLLNRYEIYSGYDFYDAGKFQSQGILAGLHFWF